MCLNIVSQESSYIHGSAGHLIEFMRPRLSFLRELCAVDAHVLYEYIIKDCQKQGFGHEPLFEDVMSDLCIHFAAVERHVFTFRDGSVGHAIMFYD